MSWVALDARERVSCGNSRIGIDCGSKTVKVVVLAADDTLVYSSYLRHRTNIVSTLITMLDDVIARIGDINATFSMTGSAAMRLAEIADVPFCQEVVATKAATKRFVPAADVVIELGGEDSKILFLSGGEELRMNSSCAGGTGGFLDTMAGMLSTNAFGMAGLAKEATHVYPIASRCCVFAQNDVRGLLNQGASRADIAASSMQAVVSQCVGGLACGRKIQGNVVFLGGPFHFLPQLVERFAHTLGLGDGCAIVPDNAHLYPAIGAALLQPETLPVQSVSGLRARAAAFTQELDGALPRLEPLFDSADELATFESRHEAFNVPHRHMYGYDGPLFLGIDSGSTTMKAVLTDDEGHMLWWSYRYNGGDTLSSAKRLISEAYRAISAGRDRAGEHAYIAKVVVTGYGEDVLLRSFNLDAGLVETVAHLKAALSLDPNVDAVLDIGGQDIKWMSVRNGRVQAISLNEACSSGCGALLGGFAHNMQMSDVAFAHEALLARYPVDLGTRCTVFMTSRVRQAQKAGATAGDISAGLAYSVVKNALFKVMNLGSANELGAHIVVQGGAFKSNALLRAFEKMVGREVARSDYPELMGAYGAALHACELADGKPSTMLDDYKVSTVEVTRTNRTCGLCGNGCTLAETIVTYDAGEAPVYNPMVAARAKVDAGTRKELARVVTGNRCSRPLPDGASDAPTVTDFVERQYRRLLERPYQKVGEGKAFAAKGAVACGVTVGIPLALSLYEYLPFWRAFFESLGVDVVLSDESTPAIYTQGMATVASESACYPAKLAHGHVLNVARKEVDFVFFPRLCNGAYGGKDGALTCGNRAMGTTYDDDCPVLRDYATTIGQGLDLAVPLIAPRIERGAAGASRAREASRASDAPACSDDGCAPHRASMPVADQAEIVLQALIDVVPGITKRQVEDALRQAAYAQESYVGDLAALAREAIDEVEATGGRGVVLACRPYHVDPEVSHGVSDLLRSFGFTVVSSDAIGALMACEEDGKGVEQAPSSLWRLGARELAAARWATQHPGFEVVHLYSFGCGIDATIMQALRDVCESSGREFTAFKMDEMVDMSSIRIRIRSLLYALEWSGGARLSHHEEVGGALGRASRREANALLPQSVLLPDWAPHHANGIEQVLTRAGVSVSRGVGNGLNTALAHANNDLCHLILSAIGSYYDYAASDAECGDEVQADTPTLLLPLACPRCCSQSTGGVLRGLARADVLDTPALIPLLEEGTAIELAHALVDADVSTLVALTRNQSGVSNFVGVAGSAVLALSPTLNNNLFDLIEHEGGAVVPPSLATQVIDAANVRARVEDAESARRLETFARCCADYQATALREAQSCGVAYAEATAYRTLERTAHTYGLDMTVDGGEGWMSPAMMLSLLDAGLDTILFVQTFACLSSHVSGLGAFRFVRSKYPDAHLAAVEFDAALSQVNLVNRVKLLLGM